MPKDPRTGLLTPGPSAPVRSVPSSIARPPYVGKQAPDAWTGGDVYTPDEVARIARASAIAADALQHLEQHVVPGITTDELDSIAHDFVTARGAYPSTLGYRGFPKASCTSLNEVICHGIPDDTRLESGDILNVDITAYFEGMHGDTNRMYLVGEVDEESRLLVERTHEAMMRGIAAAKPGRQVNIIGRVIEKYAGRFGYGVVRDYTGHGVGGAFRSGLIIPHYDAPQYTTVIEEGMVFTVEPMLTLGTSDWRLWDDGWTVVTADGSRCAQWEHTVVVTADGARLLTVPTA
ncbi:type I methionyl aminopeptidase [Pseudoclavibacter sp. JSM 162008]|uniref:type I methionyl aminopeptidase n=1 Tax=Pseudoclavibacter sp. JSM 162008 TaxID=3229855 RepID=UPI003524F833